MLTAGRRAAVWQKSPSVRRRVQPTDNCSGPKVHPDHPQPPVAGRSEFNQGFAAYLWECAGPDRELPSLTDCWEL